MQAADNRIIYFKRLLKNFEKGGLRGLRNMQKSEIGITLDAYFHPNDISVEEIYCYYTDLLIRRYGNDKTGRKSNQNYASGDSQLPSAKNLRLLATIKKAD